MTDPLDDADLEEQLTPDTQAFLASVRSRYPELPFELDDPNVKKKEKLLNLYFEWKLMQN